MWSPNDDGKWFYQRPSFQQAIVPPTAEVCDPPLVCFQLNVQYIPVILGCLTQAAQPSTWLVSTDAERQIALQRATDLIAEVAAAQPCQPTTITPPSGTTTAQQACNIAGYLSNIVIRESLLQAVQAIQNDLGILSFASTLLSLIPGLGSGFGLAYLIFSQAIIKFLANVNSGTLADYQAALSDDTLWAEVTCAIYNCIKTDGDVTDANFPCIQTALCSLSYPSTDVINAICHWITDLGAQNVIQAQVQGVLVTYDCTCMGGPTGGPPGLPPHQQSGKTRILIAAGQALGQATIQFVKAFGVPPVMIPGGTDNPIMLPAFSSVSTSSVVIEANAPRPVDVDTYVDVDWVAMLPGST